MIFDLVFSTECHDLFRSPKYTEKGRFMATVNLTWPTGLGDENQGQPNYILFTARERQLQSRDLPIGSVALPIPIGALASTYKANYENQSLGMVGAAAMGVVNDAQASGLSGAAGNVEQQITQLGALEVANAAISSVGSQTALSKFRNNVLGTVKNPYQFVTYTGPEFRSYTMNWTMIPQDASEASTIADIARFFKKHVLPTKGSDDFSTFFKMPPTFDVEMKVHKLGSATPDEDKVQKFAKCVLTSVEVDYNGIGALVPTFFLDGHPTGTKLTIGLQETQLITSSMIDAGY